MESGCLVELVLGCKKYVDLVLSIGEHANLNRPDFLISLLLFTSSAVILPPNFDLLDLMFHQFFIPNQVNNNFARLCNSQDFLLAYKFDCQHFRVYFGLVEQDGGRVVVDGQEAKCTVLELKDGVVAAVDLGEPLGTAAAGYLY